uniref:Uncharacterized protein n=1 Tax=Leersia perrieri TaxID=77586 RepID=A0A0D9WVN8_9ORYZ
MAIFISTPLRRRRRRRIVWERQKPEPFMQVLIPDTVPGNTIMESSLDMHMMREAETKPFLMSVRKCKLQYKPQGEKRVI